MNEFDFEFEDEFEDEIGEEKEEWSESVECPFCGSVDTAFLEMHYEMSAYECQVCNRRFEIEK